MTEQNINIQYVTINRNVKNALICLQIISLISIGAVLHPVFRNRRLLDSTTCTLGTALPFCCVLVVMINLTNGIAIRSKSSLAMLISNAVSFLSLVVVLGMTIGTYQSMNGAIEKSFQSEFIEVLDGNTEKGMRTLHKFQQITECCGVPLPSDNTWNQTSISPSNPWASWFYYTILNEEYIDETRRLFTLPWSCCSDRTMDCEHLAFERVSIEPSSKDVIIDELVEIEHRLKTHSTPGDGKQTVYDSICESPSKMFLSDVPFQISIVLSVFGLISLISVGIDSFFSWMVYRTK